MTTATAPELDMGHVFTEDLFQSGNANDPIGALDDLVERARVMDSHKVDFTEPAATLQMDDAFLLRVGNVAPMPLRDSAEMQMYGRLGPVAFGSGTKKALPADYLRVLPPNIRATAVNHHLGQAKKDWFIRTYKGGCRAILHDGFTDISNLELLELVQEGVAARPTQDMALVRPYLSPDSLNLRVLYKNVGGVDPRTGQREWGWGTIISNGETGDHKIKVMPFIQRGSCTNSTVVNTDESVEFIHKGSRELKLLAIMKAIQESLKVGAEVLQRMIAAHSEPVPDFEDVLAGLARKYGWDKNTGSAVAVGTHGDRTIGGIVDGVTEAAWRTRVGDAQTEMEMVGGEILQASPDFFNRMGQYGRGARLGL